jgi:CHAT domain-containing protein
VDEYKIISAPSSSMFIQSSDLARKKKSESETLLAVGNPRFSHEQFPLLTDLPSAAKEVREIMTYYGKASRILVGEVATKQRVEAEMRRADVVHLAMHSVVNEESPLHSKLVFATNAHRESSKESDGVLYAYEIYGSHLPLTHLVILSACDTGVGRYYRGEGMMGLSRTFIAAGVPLVIGSLWPVDSDATADLMINFHKHRRVDNLSSADALRAAQLDLIDSLDKRYQHPYFWAAFTLVGGYATF